MALAIAATAVAAGQRDAAVANLKAATARQLAALAVANLNNHIDLAQLFAVAGYRMDPDSQTLSALLQAVTASPHLERYLRVGEQVTALAGSADGHVVAAGTADGRLIRWDVDSGALTEVRTGGGKITSIAVSADGDRIVAAGARTYLWNADSTRPVLIHAGLVSSVAVSHPARRLPCSAGHRSCA